VSAGPANGAIQDGKVLVTAMRLTNNGGTLVRVLRVNTTSLHIGAITIPGTVVAGTPTLLAAHQRGATYGSFPSSSLVPGAVTIEVTGTYRVSGIPQVFDLKCPLRIAPASPGSAVSSSAAVAIVSPSATSSPHASTTLSPENNQASPWLVPIGPPHPLVPSPESAIVEAGAAGKGLGSVQLYLNQHVVNNSPFIGVSAVAEPSGASTNTVSAGGVTLVTFNWGAAYSTDIGAHWKPLDPTVIFSQTLSSEYRFCCDQIVQYVPSIDRFVWLLQYQSPSASPGGPNAERIAWASPAAILANTTHPAAAWSHLDITPALVGQPSTGCVNALGPVACFDYPDLAFSSNYLYASFDYAGGNNGGLEIVRIPLSALLNDQGAFTLRYTKPSDSVAAWGGHLLQRPRDTMYWVGHNSNTDLRVFSWPESSTSYNWRDVDIQGWPSTGLVSSTPAPSINWISAANLPDNSVIGLTEIDTSATEGFSGHHLVFAWTGGSGGGFPNPHVQWVEILDSGGTLGLLGQHQIWNASRTIVYPALVSNSLGVVGFGVEVGGGGTYENHAVGTLSDPTLLLTTTTSSLGTGRFGDYSTVRRDAARPALFDGFGYGVQTTAPVVDPHFVVFGKPPAPTYDQIVISIYTGNDDAEGGEIRATLSGQKVPLCLKPSNDSSIAPDGICSSGSDAVAQNLTNHWENFTFDGDSKFLLDTPQTSTGGFGTLTVTLVQPDPTCEASCDNWDLQGITVKAVDLTGTLAPVVLLDVPPGVPSGDDCIARLKGTANGNSGSVRFSLSASSPTTPTHVYVGGTFDGETTACLNNGG
jgi:hypothetical protein